MLDTPIEYQNTNFVNYVRRIYGYGIYDAKQVWETPDGLSEAVGKIEVMKGDLRPQVCYALRMHQYPQATEMLRLFCEPGFDQGTAIAAQGAVWTGYVGRAQWLGWAQRFLEQTSILLHPQLLWNNYSLIIRYPTDESEARH